MSALITGATGKQGGAVISSLLALPDQPFEKIYALTRDVNSSKSKELAQLSPVVEPVQGNLDNTDAIFESVGKGSISSVFSVQSDFKKELEHGKNLVDSAVKYGVKNFVYSSVDRSGPKSDHNPTGVPHFISKHKIEEHLIASAKATNMSWTILRPVAFYENITQDFFGKVFCTMWRDHLTRPLQLVSTKDIGWFAAQAMTDQQTWNHRKISLAGDALTFSQADEIFRKVTGKDGFPVTFSILGTAVKTGVKEMRTMFKFFEEEGYGADIAELRKIRPELLDMKKWLEGSRWK